MKPYFQIFFFHVIKYKQEPIKSRKLKSLVVLFKKKIKVRRVFFFFFFFMKHCG